MGDAHGGIGGVHRLPARTRRAVDVDAQIIVVDRDLVVDVVEEGADLHRGEAGLAAGVVGERRDPHQPVHPVLGAHPAVGVPPLQAERGRGDAGLRELARVDHAEGAGLVLGPAQVHAQQHFGPVLGLGAAGAGLDVDEGVGGIVGAGEHAGELEALDVGADRGDVTGHLGDGGLVLLLLGELEQGGGVSQAAADAVEVSDDGLELRPLPAQGLGTPRVVPGGRVLQGFLDLGEAPLLGGVVKDTP